MVQFFKPKATRPAVFTSPITVKIDRWDHQGRGMVKVNGKTVFVDGALPGETVVANIDQEKKEIDIEKFYNKERLRPLYKSFEYAPLLIMTGIKLFWANDLKVSTRVL